MSDAILPSISILTAISDSKCLNASSVEVMISSKNQPIFIRDWNDFTSKIMFNAWWASTNIGLKRYIDWNNSRHTASWGCYLHCTFQETSSPGSIYITCHHVLRPVLEHGTRSLRKLLLANTHIAKLHKLTVSQVMELTSSTVNDTALAILRSWGSQGITMLSLQRIFICDIQIWSIDTELTHKSLQTGS